MQRTTNQAYGGKPIDEYMAPGERMGGTTHGVGWGRRNYHPGQNKGDQTDYGEYTILMLEYLAGRPDPGAVSSVSLDELIPVWRARVSSPDWGAWVCTQTKATLEQVKAGKTPNDKLGGNSNAMAVRSAAALAVYADEDVAAKASRTMMFTHRSEVRAPGRVGCAAARLRGRERGRGCARALTATGHAHASSVSPCLPN